MAAFFHQTKQVWSRWTPVLSVRRGKCARASTQGWLKTSACNLPRATKHTLLFQGVNKLLLRTLRTKIKGKSDLWISCSYEINIFQRCTSNHCYYAAFSYHWRKSNFLNSISKGNQNFLISGHVCACYFLSCKINVGKIQRLQ